MATAVRRGRTWTAYWESGRDADGRRQQTTRGGFPTKKTALGYAQDRERFLRAGGNAAELERGGATWAAVWEVGRDSEGGLLTASKGGFLTQAEALRFSLEQWEKVRGGTYVPPDKLTLRGHLETWLADYAAPNTRARTLHGYRGILDRYVLPALGRVELQKLTFDHIQGLYTSLIERGLSPRTVLHTHRVLKKALQWAVKGRKLSRNPAEDATPPRVVINRE